MGSWPGTAVATGIRVQERGILRRGLWGHSTGRGTGKPRHGGPDAPDFPAGPTAPGSLPRVVYLDPAGDLAAPEATGQPRALPGGPRPLESSAETEPLQIHRRSGTAG